MKKLQNLTGVKTLSTKEQKLVKGGSPAKDVICDCNAPDGTDDCMAWCSPCPTGHCN